MMGNRKNELTEKQKRNCTIAAYSFIGCAIAGTLVRKVVKFVKWKNAVKEKAEWDTAEGNKLTVAFCNAIRELEKTDVSLSEFDKTLNDFNKAFEKRDVDECYKIINYVYEYVHEYDKSDEELDEKDVTLDIHNNETNVETVETEEV